MTEKRYEVIIKGVSPLLQNRFSSEIDIGATKKKTATQKENRVEDTLYELEGQIYQPGESIKQSLIEAGKAFKKGRSNMSKSFASFILIEPDAIVHEQQGWVTDRRAVVIPSTRGRVMRNRAKFNEWSLSFEVLVLDDDVVGEKDLHDALDHAGHFIGIGDFRPEKKGIFGRFIVAQIRAKK